MKKYLNTILLLPALFVLASIGGDSAAAQSGDSKAGLVIQFPDGSTQTFCIPFAGDSISGLDMLLKTGLEVKVEAYGGLGAEICKIGSTGCNYPDEPCACQSFGPGGVYWSYHHVKDGQWKASIVGAGSYKVHNGDIEGWAWSEGKAPALYSFSQLCPAAAPQPTELPTSAPLQPSPTPIPPSPTSQPQPPTSTRVPTSKPVPTTTKRPTQPTPTADLLPPTETAIPAPSTVQALPTVIATQAPSTSTSTATSTDTPTPEPTGTYTHVPAATATSRPAATPTVTLSEAPTAQPTVPNSEATARGIGVVIGGLVVGSLAVWGVVTVLRRGRQGHRGGSSRVD